LLAGSVVTARGPRHWHPSCTCRLWFPRTGGIPANPSKKLEQRETMETHVASTVILACEGEEVKIIKLLIYKNRP
jgi:hypothetical protein